MASEACPGPCVSWGRSAVRGCELPRAGHLGVLQALWSTKADGPRGRKQHQRLAREGGLEVVSADTEGAERRKNACAGLLRDHVFCGLSPVTFFLGIYPSIHPPSKHPSLHLCICPAIHLVIHPLSYLTAHPFTHPSIIHLLSHPHTYSLSPPPRTH